MSSTSLRRDAKGICGWIRVSLSNGARFRCFAVLNRDIGGLELYACMADATETSEKVRVVAHVLDVVFFSVQDVSSRDTHTGDDICSVRVYIECGR